MVLRPSEPRSAKPERRYVGFDRHGQWVRSSVPIRNEATAAVRQLCAEIPKKLLCPAEVLQIWLANPNMPGVPSDVALKMWPKATRFSDWQLLKTDSHVEIALACFGLSIQNLPWIADPHAWEQLCDQAEALNGQESRYAVALRELPIVHRWLPGISLETMHGELLAAVRESDARRGRQDAIGLDSYSELMQPKPPQVLAHAEPEEDVDLPVRSEDGHASLRKDG